MKFKMICLTAICLLIALISTAEALPTYTVSTTNGRQGSGGPFEISGNGMDFLTMCVETNEFMSFNTPYYGSIDPVVVFGSLPNTVPIADRFLPINTNTAKLYDYFLDNPGLTSNEKAGIQIAIWSWQMQPGYTSPPPPATSPSVGYWANFYYYAASGYTLDRTIVALNLWNTDVGDGPYTNYLKEDNYINHKVQSMLIQVPEPGILILLGIAMSAIGAASWRIRKL